MAAVQGFAGEVAVVTGAASGIGRALCLSLAEAGAIVEASDVDLAGAQATAADCRARGADAEATRLDVSDAEAVAAHAADVEARRGQVDLVVNNAGVALAARVTEQTVADVDRVLAINLGGVIAGTQAFLPALHRARAGRLVNVSSLFGLVPAPLNSAYSASKFAVRGYSEALAIELALADSPVSVTVVHPGGVATAIASSATVAEGNEALTAAFGRALRLSPDRAARIILRGVARRRRRVLVGAEAYAGSVAAAVLGHRLQHVLAASLRPRLGAGEARRTAGGQ